MIFDRQIAFWGEEKQRMLERASIFVAGLGGLGCLLSELLVRAGVGKVYICDKGTIDEPDLNRQLFYTQHDIGKRKLAVATDWLTSIHTHSQIIPVQGDIKDDNFVLPKDIDGVADCLDNFETRFALWEKLPENAFFVHTGVEQFFGQIMTFIKGNSPELNTIFANYNKRERVIPVSGVSAAALSSLSANEVLNNVFCDPKLKNTMLIVDLSDFTFDKVSF
ncbi:MAG: HesA/MoeB/ThiF family protein [Proteobacteria bacterium]|nr:HesA/MoeB/ThiF family protein [Pseudomonadota bacterium]